MQRRGAIKAANEKPKGFITALQKNATTRNQDLSQSRTARPVFCFTESTLTAILISKENCELRGSRSGSFYASLLETLLADRIVTEDSPEFLRQQIAGFAMANGAEQTSQGYSLLNLCSITLAGISPWKSTLDGGKKKETNPAVHTFFFLRLH
jgi:hypothetical protein